MFNESAFRNAIRDKRETLDMAAKVMGISKVTLYRKISGESDFFRDEMQRFCAYYEVSPANIFFATKVS